jgi:hypothetical protein
MGDRRSGRKAHGRTCDGADRAEHHCARERAKRGVAAAMLVRQCLRRNQRQRCRCDRDGSLHLEFPSIATEG